MLTENPGEQVNAQNKFTTRINLQFTSKFNKYSKIKNSKTYSIKINSTLSTIRRHISFGRRQADNE